MYGKDMYLCTCIKMINTLEDNNDSVLDKIPQSNSGYLYDGWANGAMGTIADYDGKNVYKFHKALMNSQGNFVWDSITLTMLPSWLWVLWHTGYTIGRMTTAWQQQTLIRMTARLS